ncbi:Na+/H+ dicarboxylate symporter [Candidatus Methanoperedens nitroreducens]|uniref:Na+/H+ dicarboxylate symporter n=1 Tax=Candidatus Methanoperedens nitratireducens TaxID=1392998 RepID=A0A062V154_9EURY|nr:dicarboxylate/amino acid:cation symporter [Candidatus Methanoperedens nitroreducens]KCZ71117.1 Na+/H+ dicarboxylate symporter [Candidatus Methanoperedens nitroreducens]MDJ1421506.1 dicarboxylate/amino acid:cation symporter [Candidatus Methanoperedens sp.]
MPNRDRHPLEYIHPRSLKYLSDHLQSLVKGRLWLKILLGMLLGIAVGIVLGPSAGLVEPGVSGILSEWLSVPGYIFLGLLQMIVIPLVFASIIRGIAASEGMDQLRKVGLRVGGYFLLTTAIAIGVGIGVALLIQPGRFISSELVQSTMDTATPTANQGIVSTPTLGEVPGLIGALLPSNPLGAIVSGQMLQVVLFAIILGIAIVSTSPRQSKPILDLAGSMQEVCMTIVKWAMLLAPVAVFGLLAKFTARVGIEALMGMLVYVGTVLLGLVIILCLYLIIVLFTSGMSPWRFLAGVREVMLLAFSTSSSAAVMPLSIKTAEEKLGVRPSISQFVIPLGATINMNGTALYQSVATVFLAQVFGMELGLGALLLIIVTVVGSSIGTPATPGVGIVILALVLNSVGIPTSGIALIIGVDRIVDMSRTAINVTGDLAACKVMDRWVGSKKSAEKELAEETERELRHIRTGEDVILDVD